ncbi:hypothetical protein PHLGIDRAFT_128811 [Phlebiopsis gigantea 11061_1 CR5-6]|uniref:DNA polymerase delta subunit 4 n=1 Tax=Phlebiopsis gigantea (strain 11061_1 CR5-6) TaxID=745531 RepID=A0A0C3RVV8_PHLG1|nr:hypothetical protein PHLGIDRAFT_128811 [Phlebiopsis gigantea 11061_1 CR5-6]
MSSMSPKPKPVLKQSLLQFGSRKSSKTAAEGKGKGTAPTVHTPVAEIYQPINRGVYTISDDSDIEEFTAPEQELSEVELVKEIEEPAEPASSRASKRGKGTAPAVETEKVVDEDDIEDTEEDQPLKKKRRTSRRTARASIETPADEDAATSKKKGKQVKSAKGNKDVFKSRDGTENSEPMTEESWEVGSKKIKITTKDNKVAKHVDVAAMRKHFGYVRGKMGNVKPVHATNHSMEDHILRFFDLSYEFGPCIGVSRLQRWDRAEALGLNPPIVVKQLLTNEDGSERIEMRECVFYGDV